MENKTEWTSITPSEGNNINSSLIRSKNAKENPSCIHPLKITNWFKMKLYLVKLDTILSNT